MNRTASIFIRFGICILLIVVYFFGWRPVRTVITQKIVYPQLIEAQNEASVSSYTIKNEGVVLWINFKRGNTVNEFQYRPQAGFFFLIALLTLVFVTLDPKWHLILLGLHLGSTIVTAALMLLSKHGWYLGFILVDLIGTYLVPAVSLALAAWVVAQEREK